MKTKLARLVALVAFVVAGAAGCSGDDPAGPGGGPVADVDGYLADLPDWDAFARNAPDELPSATGETVEAGTTEVEVREIQDDGSLGDPELVRYRCRQTPYTVTRNPDEIVMFSPDLEDLWPGGFIQGASYTDETGVGGFDGLVIDERAPIQVVIPELPSSDATRVVENPNLGTVTATVRDMIGAASRDTLDTPSSISFTQETYHSESSWALSVGASGRYLGFQARAEGDLSRNVSETTVTAKFVQRMYRVLVPRPSTPRGWFSSALTPERLQFYAGEGLIGPNNVPVYVSQIVYGRMLMVSITSTASAQEIRTAIRASYNSIGGGASGSIDRKSEEILRSAKVAILSIGGPAEATQDMIRTNDLGAYFTRSAALSTAEPISFTFSTLDGRIAKVTEATDYTIEDCTPVGASGEPFVFLDEQQVSVPISTPARTVVGDFDGDGIMDIAFTHASASKNETLVGLANGDGTFDFGAVVENPETPTEGWADYTPVVGDFDGDLRDDIAWNLRSTNNVTYVGLSDGNGGFAFGGRQQAAPTGWGSYRVFAGDVGGDGIDDLIFNTIVGTNRTYVARGRDTGEFEFLAHQDRGTGFGAYDVLVGDVNGDNRTDIVWNVTESSRNGIYMGFGTTGGRFSMTNYQERSSNGWDSYSVLIGNVGGGAGDDLVWPNLTTQNIPVHLSYGSGSGFAPGPLAWVEDIPGSRPLDAQLVDVDGDGKKDLLLNERDGTINRVNVGLATDASNFVFTPVPMTHPATVSWEQYSTFVGDFDGDGREDVLWSLPAATNRIFVALAADTN